MSARALNVLAGLIPCVALKDRIKKAKGARTNAEFARLMDVSAATVTMWLKGTTKSLKGDNAARMEEVTGYRARWLAEGKGAMLVSDPEPVSDEQQELLRVWFRIGAEDRKELLKRLAEMGDRFQANLAAERPQLEHKTPQSGKSSGSPPGALEFRAG